MDDRERARVLASLPPNMTEAELSPPEGDLHFDAKVDAKDDLEGFFKRRGQRIYVACDLTVYYPGKPRFAPDVLVAFDVDDHKRTRWVVSHEGKGLDWVLEVHVGGDRKKDYAHHPVYYASLGIPEYFLYDRAANRLFGWRLAAPDARHYVPIMGQFGRFASQALGLDLVLEDHQLRFYVGNAPLLHQRELAVRLAAALADSEAARADSEAARADSEAARADSEAARAESEAALADSEAARQAIALQRDEQAAELARLREEIERLRRN